MDPSLALDDETEVNDELRAPFPWFGGKRRVADLVWSRLGNVQSYNEPFAGSLAVLLGRPHVPRVETVNDLDSMLANFWRALQHDPHAVAHHADWPVNEADLHARHRWLVSQLTSEFRERMQIDPEYYDAKIAGWWVWGQCLWIGSGWCQAGKHANGSTAEQVSKWRPRPDGQRAIDRKRPAANHSGDSVGVHKRSLHRRWQGGGLAGGSGIHAPRLSQQLPALNGDAGATGHGIHASAFEEKTGGLYVYMRQLAERLRRVRVCCGDWRRILTPSVTTYIGTCGVFLDPPYAHDQRERCYSEDHDISAEVAEWARANGENTDFRIALCGYDGEHTMPESWECVPWKAHGGYSRTERGVANRSRERIWFSPHCLRVGLPFEAVI